MKLNKHLIYMSVGHFIYLFTAIYSIYLVSHCCIKPFTTVKHNSSVFEKHSNLLKYRKALEDHQSKLQRKAI